MPRGVVVIGVPANLETREFEFKKGDRAGEQGVSLSFVLAHPATSMSGAVQMETRNPALIEEVQAAFGRGESVQIAAVPDVVKYDKDGEERHFFKMRAVAIVGSV